MKNAKAGFSLIEVLITIALIAIVAVTALSFIVYCDRLALQADTRIVAANFVRETTEVLYKKDYRDISLSATTGDGLSDPLPTDPAFGSGFISRYPIAARTYTVTDNSDYKLITVKVTWSR